MPLSTVLVDTIESPRTTAEEAVEETDEVEGMVSILPFSSRVLFGLLRFGLGSNHPFLICKTKGKLMGVAVKGNFQKNITS